MKKIFKISGVAILVALLLTNISLFTNNQKGLNLDGLLTLSSANAEDSDGTMYEDKFDLSIVGGVPTLGVCCDVDETDGCWDIWKKC